MIYFTTSTSNGTDTVQIMGCKEDRTLRVIYFTTDDQEIEYLYEGYDLEEAMEIYRDRSKRIEVWDAVQENLS